MNFVGFCRRISSPFQLQFFSVWWTVHPAAFASVSLQSLLYSFTQSLRERGGERGDGEGEGERGKEVVEFCEAAGAFLKSLKVPKVKDSVELFLLGMDLSEHIWQCRAHVSRDRFSHSYHTFILLPFNRIFLIFFLLLYYLSSLYRQTSRSVRR